MILKPLGWTRLVCHKNFTTYCDGSMKICLCPTDEQYVASGFHRKRTGLNHLAFYAQSKSEVDDFYQNILVKNNIHCLYEKAPSGDDDYYAVFFEDPDRIKLEVVFAPKYCDPSDWTNTIKDNFNPYQV